MKNSQNQFKGNETSYQISKVESSENASNETTGLAFIEDVSDVDDSQNSESICAIPALEVSQRKKFKPLLESFNFQQEQRDLPYFSGISDSYATEGFEVFGLDESTSYNVILTRTSVEANLNDFAVIKILENPNESKVRYYFRSGRIGCYSQIKHIETSLNEAMKLFKSSFLSLTGNSWSKNLENFEYKTMKFDILRTTKIEFPIAVTDTDLCPSIIDLIQLIMTYCTPKMTTLELLANERKGLTELGRLEPCEIEKAAGCLISIHNQKNRDMDLLNKLNNNFYQKIPLSFQEGSNLPLIIGRKSLILPEMIRLLDFIREPLCYPTSRLTKKEFTAHAYEKYKFGIELLDKESFYFETINSAIKKTAIPAYGKPTLRNVFMLHDKQQDEQFESLCKNLGNCQLLWHGTKLSNINSILKYGLQINPIQATTNNGSGIYFTDIISCAINFSKEEKAKEFIVFLCEVVVGLPQLVSTRQSDPPSFPFNCNKTIGFYHSNEERKIRVNNNDVLFRVGKVKTTCNERSGRNTLCSETIVYNSSQVKPSFLVLLSL